MKRFLPRWIVCKRITILRLLVFCTMQAVVDAPVIVGRLVLEVARLGVLVTVGEAATVPEADLQIRCAIMGCLPLR